MVGYDYFSTLLFDVFDFFRAGNSAVDRNKKLRKMLLEYIVYSLYVKTVTVAALGNVSDGFYTEVAQRRAHYRCGANTVRVVIAVHYNLPFLVARASYKPHRVGHTAHFKWRNEMLARGVNKPLYLFLVVYSARVKNFYGIRQKPAGSRKGINAIELFFRIFKFGYCSFHI